ncbi:MAG: S9 family peptidase, partial [Acidobacteriota bacterium]
ALTRMNPQVEGFQLGSTELVRWKNPDGGEVEGVLVKPADFEAGRKYPMIVEPHGGPAGIQQTRFNATWQVYAGRGYVVFAPNFRGSDGYGKAFIEANVGKWGVVDFQDIMSGVDHVISLGFVDPDRMGVEGWSYGGYMSQFIVSHTDRFKAAVPGAGMSNMISFYGTTDIQRFTIWYMTGHPWETLEIYRRSSPIFNVDKVKTPTRILFGEQDRRVPIEQGEQFYTALKQRGIEVEMIRYPREPHGLQEPYHQIDRIERTVEWFDRFLKK